MFGGDLMNELKKQYKHMPRDEKEVQKMKSRLHRMVGQLNGIEKMLDEGRSRVLCRL